MRARLAVCLTLLAAASPLATSAQQAGAPGNVSGTTFSSDELQLRFSWKPELNQSSPASAFDQGVLDLPGVSHVSDSDAQGGGTSFTACLRPSLFLESPLAQNAHKNNKPAKDTKKNLKQNDDYATVMLAELDPNCLSPVYKNFNGPALPAQAKLLLASPGMTQRAQPATYNVSGHPVVMVESQGHPLKASERNQSGDLPFNVYTMVVATEWNNHTLFWVLTASSIHRLDQLSKSQVQFGSANPAPLYPQPIEKSGAIGPPTRQ